MFLSAIEPIAHRLEKLSPWNLVSMYYKPQRNWDLICDSSELVMVDSGAHSFQKGATVDFDDWTRRYGEFIATHDNDKVLGYFEMDVDNRVGYDKVLEYRRILEGYTDKVIPVWHKNRGWDDFVDTCKRYKGRIVAISGFVKEDIRQDQYGLFIRTAWRYGAQIHALGMGNARLMKKYPFNFTDSASWKNLTAYGKVETGHGKLRTKRGQNGMHLHQVSYSNVMNQQAYFYRYWHKLHEVERPWEQHG